MLRLKKNSALFLALFFVPILGFWACRCTKPAKQVTETTPKANNEETSFKTITSIWLLEAITDPQTHRKEPRPKDEPIGSFIFELNDNGKKGRCLGKTRENSINGDYTLSAPDRVSFELAGTKMAEKGWGSRTLALFAQVRFYDIKNGRLLLYGADRAQIFQLRKIDE